MTTASSLSLAAKHRPRSFATIVGQHHVTEVLRRAVDRQRVPQQLLFSGRSGLGKTTVARVVATAMLCETPADQRDRGELCGACSACQAAFTAAGHPDIIEFDAASHGGKDEIREIANRAQVAPLRAEQKVYIVDEAHGLSHGGGQAFLKLLEEPPAHVVFMLCTTDPQKMLKTNRGRCVEFELLAPTDRELVTNLRRICVQEGWSPPDAVLRAAIAAADADLGVRGTVTALAKLTTLLDETDDPPAGEVATLLGTPPPVVLAQLIAAVRDGDRAGALRQLADARQVAADSALLEQLRRWAVERVTGALDDTEQLTVELWRLEKTLDATAEPGRLELLVATLAQPTLDGPAGGQALTAEARTLLDQLSSVVTTHRDAAAAASTAANRSAPSVDAAPAAHDAANSPTPATAQLLAAAAPVPQELPELLGRCRVQVGDDHVTVVAPDELVPALTPHVPQLRTAAGRLGLPLKTYKSSSAEQTST